MIFVVVDWHSIHGTLLGLSSRHLPSSGLTNPNPLNALFLRHFAPVQSFSLCDLLCRSGLAPPLVFLFVGETLLSSAGFLWCNNALPLRQSGAMGVKGLTSGFLGKLRSFFARSTCSSTVWALLFLFWWLLFVMVFLAILWWMLVMSGCYSVPLSNSQFEDSPAWLFSNARLYRTGMASSHAKYLCP